MFIVIVYYIFLRDDKDHNDDENQQHNSWGYDDHYIRPVDLLLRRHGSRVV